MTLGVITRNPMSRWELICRMIWYAAKYLFLLVFSSIAGAILGSGVGLAIGAWTGEPAWATHGRCAGWTLFVLVAAIGAPFGFPSIHTDNGRRPGRRHLTRSLIGPDSRLVDPERIEGRVKSILVAPLLGAFMGLILGGIAGGFLIALYFFAVLSPLGPGGWWPILPLTFQPSDGGFITEDRFILFPYLVVVGLFVITGVCLGFFGTVSCGKKHYQVFGSKIQPRREKAEGDSGF